MVEASAAHLLAAVGRVIAVTSRDDLLMRVLDDCGCQVIVNEHAAEGMGSSIAAGVVASIAASMDANMDESMTTPADPAGWIIALGDMPYVQQTTIATVCQQLTAGCDIVVPTHRGQRGHPVGFARQYGRPLSELQGDSGARTVIDAALIRDPSRIFYFNTDDRGVLADIDVPADLR